MKNIILFGGGGHCLSCIDVIRLEEKYVIEGIVDNKRIVNSNLEDLQYLGNDSQIDKILCKYKNVLITVGQIKRNTPRINLYKKLKSFGAKLVVVKSPLSYLARGIFIGEGSIIMHKAILNYGASIQDNCIINTSAVIEHEVSVNSHCHVSTGVIINGGASINEGTFIGSGSIIHERVKIGKNCIIAAGSVIKRDIPDNTIIK